MFRGSIVALVTPMKKTGEIDYECFLRLIDWHLANGTDGLVVLGTTGESPTISEIEREKLVKLAIEQVKDRVPVIVGTGTNSTYTTIKATQKALEWGADAALLVTPYYNKPTQEGLYQHFKAVADAVPLPQILYNVPSRTGCDLLPETVVRLAQVPNIVAIKEASGDVSRVRKLLDAGCQLDLLTGDDATSLEFMLAGGVGVITVVGNVVPKLFHDFCVAAVSEDKNAARALFAKIEPLCKNLFLESNPIPTKWALIKMGKIEEGIRLPLTPMSKQFNNQVQQAMLQAGISLTGV